MFRIKICGVTKPDDAIAAAQAGADALGLNFYAGSPRFLLPESARAVVDCIPRGVIKVGVFVNASVAEMKDAVSTWGLDYLQLHGDEPPELLTHLARCPVLRAFRLDERRWQPIVEYVAACRAAGTKPAGLLIDAHVSGMYGGTGRTAEWEIVRNRPDELGELPIVLAGGLTPENVSTAIATAAPWTVDTASGVESSPGIKDHARVRQFVSHARAALVKLETRL
jgi:phosphoribosylanthranilate isomerase